MRFSLRQFEYFAAAAEAGSITLASERIRISQASISTAISRLEEELGVSLFVRSHAQGLALTSAGERIYAQIRQVLAGARNLYESANQIREELRGNIALGCLTTLAPMVIPEICQSFRGLHPSIDFKFVEGAQDQLISNVRRGEIDLAITYAMHIPDDIEFQTLVELPPLVLVAKDHHFAGRREVTLAEAAAEPYVLLDLPHSRDYFLSLFEKVNLKPNITTRTSQPDVVRAMVANGYGISIFVVRPRNDRALDGKQLVSVPLDGSVDRLALGYLLKAGLRKTKLISEFEAHVCAHIDEHQLPGMLPLTE